MRATVGVTSSLFLSSVFTAQELGEDQQYVAQLGLLLAHIVRRAHRDRSPHAGGEAAHGRGVQQELPLGGGVVLAAALQGPLAERQDRGQGVRRLLQRAGGAAPRTAHQVRAGPLARRVRPQPHCPCCGRQRDAAGNDRVQSTSHLGTERGAAPSLSLLSPLRCRSWRRASPLPTSAPARCTGCPPRRGCGECLPFP